MEIYEIRRRIHFFFSSSSLTVLVQYSQIFQQYFLNFSYLLKDWILFSYHFMTSFLESFPGT